MIESSESQNLVCENDILIVDVLSDREDLTYVDWSGAIREFLDHKSLWDIVEDASAENSEVASAENSEVAGSDDNEVVGADDNEVAGADDNEVARADDNEVAGADDNEVAGAGNNEVVGVEDNEVVGADDNEVAGAGNNEVDWTEKNAKALYLIMDSCGSKRFSLISNIDSAKEAWCALRHAHDTEMFVENFDSHYDPGRYSSPLSRKYTCSIILK